MVWWWILLLTVVAWLTGCARRLDPSAGQQRQAHFSGRVSVDVEVPYLLYVPESYSTKGAPSPLLIFLHGAGERGTDLSLVRTHGPPKLIHGGRQFPFVVISPQCPKDARWSVLQLDALFDHLMDEYNIDEDRIYLTGLSMGGFGTWAWSMARPRRFAAIAPVCGGGDSWRASLLRNVPVWAFHGAKDTVVPLARSQEMVEAIRASGGNVRFTIYPEATHDSWTETYENDELYRWLLEHRREE